jgi:hypothetical protein
LAITTDEVIVHSDGALRARVAGGPVLTCSPTRAIRFDRAPSSLPSWAPPSTTHRGGRP